MIQIEIEWVSTNYPEEAKDYTVSIYHDKRNAVFLSKYKLDGDGNIEKGATSYVNYDGTSPNGFNSNYSGSRAPIPVAGGGTTVVDYNENIPVLKSKPIPICKSLQCAFEQATSFSNFW